MRVAVSAAAFDLDPDLAGLGLPRGDAVRDEDEDEAGTVIIMVS